MYVLDTDHVSLLQRGGEEAQRIRRHLQRLHQEDVFLTIVSFEEQTRGWLAVTARARTIEQQQAGYARLSELLEIYCGTPVLPFDQGAVDQFQRLWLQRLRIGTMDLKIAAVAMANGATLVTRNRSDFSKVPGLEIDDWTL